MALESRKKSGKTATTQSKKKSGGAGSRAVVRRTTKGKKTVGSAAAARSRKRTVPVAVVGAGKKTLEIRIAKGDQFVPNSPHLGSHSRIEFKVRPKRAVEVRYTGPGRLLVAHHRSRWFAIDEAATYEVLAELRSGAYEFSVRAATPKGASEQSVVMARGRAGTINVP